MPMAKHNNNWPEPTELTPCGLPASFFSQFKLTCVAESQKADPPMPSTAECIARFERANPGYLRDHYATSHDDNDYILHLQKQPWHEIARRIDFEILAKAFTFEELVRHWWNDFVMSSISEELHNNPSYMIFRKIHNSLWHWGWEADWNLFVNSFYALQRFDFGLEGFQS